MCCEQPPQLTVANGHDLTPKISPHCGRSFDAITRERLLEGVLLPHSNFPRSNNENMTDMIDFQDAFRIHMGTWDEMAVRATKVRMMVFVEEQGVPLVLECDSFDAVSRHVLAVDTNGNTIGTGRLLPDGHVGRMAVLPEWRGKGVGAALLRKLMESARENGVQQLALNAQIRAVPFYTRFGFVPVGSEFVEAGILHLAMIRDLRG